MAAISKTTSCISEKILQYPCNKNLTKSLYEQIAMQIKSMIMNGELRTDSLLPSVRELSKLTNVSILTIRAAYDTLKYDGFIETFPGRGSFVMALDKDFVRKEQLRRAEQLLQQVADIGRIYGIPLDTLVEMLKNLA